MSFTLRQLSYFIAAAEHGSVSHAAQSLSISQSAVTEAIRDLEADLGVRLFDRHARGLTITHRGHRFLRHARAILAEVAGARRAFDSDRAALAGSLHLGVTALMAGYVMSDFLARFRRANPGVTVTAIEDSGEYLEHLLIGGELDVAVMVVGGLRDRAALMVEILDVSPFRLWLPLGHPLATQESISLSDVTAEPLIMLTVEEIEDETTRLLSAFGRRPRVAFRTRSVEAVRSLVATGAGIALLPDLVYRPWSLEGDRIESRDVSGALPVVQVGLVWRRGTPLSAAALEFVAISQATQALRGRT
jgi:DNA-binding transcriptional LysR family regulator